MIQKTSVEGYYVDADTMNKIGEYLDDYHAIVEERKKDVPEEDKQQVINDLMKIEDICQSIGIPGYEFT